METMQTPDLETLDEALTEIVASVASAMLRSEAFPITLRLAKHPLQAAVFVTGAWNGAVQLECDGETAKNFCAGLMRIPRPETVDIDVLDSLGELANMVGGNLKSILPPGCLLSTPTVRDGSQPRLRHAAQARISRTFDGPEGPFMVTLFAIEPGDCSPRPQ